MANIEGDPRTRRDTNVIAEYISTIASAFMQAPSRELPAGDASQPTDQSPPKETEETPHATNDPGIPDRSPTSNADTRPERGRQLPPKEQWLSPRAFQAMHGADALFKDLIQRGSRAAVGPAIMDRLHGSKHGAMSLHLAYAALLRLGAYQTHNTIPEVRKAAGDHLISSQHLFKLNAGRPLRPEVAKQFGWGSGNLPEELASDHIPDPPLHLLVLAADVINANADSVLPTEKVQILEELGMPAEMLQAKSRDTGEKFDHLDSRERHKIGQDLRNEQVRAIREDRKQQISALKQALSDHLTRYYGITADDKTGTLGLLIECRIAERLGFNHKTPGALHMITERLKRAMDNVDPAQAPNVASVYKRITGT
jgi:hypothetical protein